jgi:uncharacterized cupredoxin-like copper-binding protein
MTTVAETQAATVQAERSTLERTFAMVVVAAGCWILAAGLLYFLAYVIIVYAPALGDEGLVAEVLPIFIVFAAILVTIGILAVAWPGARRHAWFWLAPVVPSVLLLAMNAQDIPYDLTRPANFSPFLITILVLAGALGAICGGIVAMLEVRSGRPRWTRSGPAGWLSLVVIGVAAGAIATSLLAGVVSAAGTALEASPTSTAVIIIEDARFVASALRMRDGDVLGLLVSNPTDIGHSFDIDSLDIHVLLSAHTTTAIPIQPSNPDRLLFYCSVHGHLAAGMAGTIDVE